MGGGIVIIIITTPLQSPKGFYDDTPPKTYSDSDYRKAPALLESRDARLRWTPPVPNRPGAKSSKQPSVQPWWFGVYSLQCRAPLGKARKPQNLGA